MTVEGLKDILRQKEGTEIEFKQSREHLPRNVYESVCAFLNRRGGHVVLGVDDDGKVVGISQTHIQEQLDTLSKDMNNPQVMSSTFYLNFEVLEVEGKKVIYFYVPQSSQAHNHKNVPLIFSGRKPIVEEQDEFRMILPFNPLSEQESDQADPKSDPVGENGDLESKMVLGMAFCLENGDLSTSELMTILNLTHRPSFRKNYLHPALELGIIEYTLPDELRSPNQKYRLTPKGRLLLNKRKQK